jgi:hypothetical protein
VKMLPSPACDGTTETVLAVVRQGAIADSQGVAVNRPVLQLPQHKN